MKVHELVEQLQRMPQNLEVLITNDEFSSADAIGSVSLITKENWYGYSVNVSKGVSPFPFVFIDSN